MNKFVVIALLAVLASCTEPFGGPFDGKEPTARITALGAEYDLYANNTYAEAYQQTRRKFGPTVVQVEGAILMATEKATGCRVTQIRLGTDGAAMSLSC